MTPRMINLLGKRFGKLLVKDLLRDGAPRKRWICLCDCGQVAVCLGSNLKRGNSTSCGCSRIKHGMSGTKIHGLWRQMHYRCSNKNDAQYDDYGGRGIKVCVEWDDFSKFFVDMGHPPRGGTLERKDNNGPYCKENCRWATRREQSRNKRTNRMITVFGRSQTVTDWAIEYKMPPRTLFNRLYRAGMAPEEALTTKPYAQQRGLLKENT